MRQRIRNWLLASVVGAICLGVFVNASWDFIKRFTSPTIEAVAAAIQTSSTAYFDWIYAPIGRGQNLEPWEAIVAIVLLLTLAWASRRLVGSYAKGQGPPRARLKAVLTTATKALIVAAVAALLLLVMTYAYWCRYETLGWTELTLATIRPAIDEKEFRCLQAELRMVRSAEEFYSLWTLLERTSLSRLGVFYVLQPAGIPNPHRRIEREPCSVALRYAPANAK